MVLLREDLSGLGTIGPCNNVIINVCRDRGHFDLEYQAVMMERGGGGEGHCDRDVVHRLLGR